MLSSSARLRRPDHVRPLRTLVGHTDTIRSLAFFPDSRRIASSSWDNTVRVWDIESGLQLTDPFAGHTDVVRSVAVSPDGQKIASAAEDHTFRVWSISTGQLLYDPVEGHASGLWCVVFSPDGRRIATTGDNAIRIWDADTGQPVAGPFRSHNGNLYALTYSPDGLEIASVANDKTVCVCDADIGQMLLGRMEGHESDVRCVLYTPDGRHLVTASDDGTIRVWDVLSGEQVGEPMRSHINIITSIAISPDGTFLATAGPHIVMQVWNLVTRQVAGPPLRHANDVSCVAFSFDGRYLVGGCCDFRIWVWDADVLRQPCPDLPPHPLPKADPSPRPAADFKPDDHAVLLAPTPPPSVPLPPPTSISIASSIRERPRSHHRPPSSPRTGSAQMAPLPVAKTRMRAVVIKGLWKRRTRHQRICSAQESETSDVPKASDRLQTRFRRFVKGLSHKPIGAEPTCDATGIVEDIQEVKWGHDPHPISLAQDDGDEVLFLCCYFARTRKREQVA